MKEEPLSPEHMDRWSRNQRLYETLKGMGLYVVPIPEDHDPAKIRHLVVSADLLVEQPAENAAQSGVVPEMKRALVGDVVTPAESDGDNVIHFPTVL